MVHLPPEKGYSKQQRDELGVEDEEEDMEIIVNRVDHGYITEAVTLDLLRHYTKKDKLLSHIVEDVRRGKLRPEHEKSKFASTFSELSCMQGLLLRGDRVVITQALRADVHALAHEGHPGTVEMLQQLLGAVWWPGMTTDVTEYVKTCNVGCASVVHRTVTPPMTIRETPERPW